MPEQTGTFPTLAEAHKTKLLSSAVSADVAHLRGYRSAYTRKAVREAGFGQAQANVVTKQAAALLIPLHDVTGAVAGYQMRPDKPRTLSDRVVKYESPARQAMLLDVPPQVRAELGNPGVPLFITEGPIKADALASCGMVSVALLGVWGWRGRNDDQATAALGAFEAIALRKRRVYICFDSDVITKTSVQLAMSRLSAFLRSRGAEVAIVKLPSLDNGAKQGVDDWLAADPARRVDELVALAVPDVGTIQAERELPPPPEDIAPVLDEIGDALERFVIFSDESARDALVLFVAHTWSFAAASASPRINITSAAPECGKSRLAEILNVLCRAPRYWIAPSAAVLFRTVDLGASTLILDEVDHLFDRHGDADAGLLQALINAGYRAGGSVPRVERNGDSFEAREFAVFAPIVLCGIGKLPAVTASRSLVITLQRRIPGVDRRPDDFTHNTAMTEYTQLRDLLESWARAHMDDLRASSPEVEDRLQVELGDRYREVWAPLLAIADLAGTRWAKAARIAMETIGKAQQGRNEYLPISLVQDIHRLFHRNNPITGAPEVAEYLSTQDVLEGLREDERWSGYGYDSQGISKHSLAKMLAEFDITPGYVGPRDGRKRGYRRDDFADVWNRYLHAPVAESPTNVHHRAHRARPANTGDVAVHVSDAVHVQTCTPTETCTPPGPENGGVHGVHVGARSLERSEDNTQPEDPNAHLRTRPGGGGVIR